MSKTTKKVQGKTYKPRKKDNKSKSKGAKKFFGHTSGAHSRGKYKREYTDNGIVYTKLDDAPVKGEDFVKYGYPMETRSKKVIKALQQEREAAEEIKRVNEEED